MNDLHEAASPAAVNAWRGAQADFASALRYWDKPLAREVERLVDVTVAAFESATIWQALADGWSIEHLFGYGADDAQEVASFGIYTGIGLGMFRELLLVEGNLAILKWAHPGEASFRYDRRVMEGKAMVPWWRHRRLDPGPGRFAPLPLDDVLGRLV